MHLPGPVLVVQIVLAILQEYPDGLSLRVAHDPLYAQQQSVKLDAPIHHKQRQIAYEFTGKLWPPLMLTNDPM
eukprot:SAG31_NODE_7994_length_1545_cov_1.172891_2_plen_73_part_00